MRNRLFHRLSILAIIVAYAPYLIGSEPAEPINTTEITGVIRTKGGRPVKGAIVRLSWLNSHSDSTYSYTLLDSACANDNNGSCRLDIAGYDSTVHYDYPGTTTADGNYRLHFELNIGLAQSSNDTFRIDVELPDGEIREGKPFARSAVTQEAKDAHGGGCSCISEPTYTYVVTRAYYSDRDVIVE